MQQTGRSPLQADTWYLVANADSLSIKIRDAITIGEDDNGLLKLNSAAAAERWFTLSVDDAGQIEVSFLNDAAAMEAPGKWATQSSGAILAQGTVMSLPNNELYISQDLQRGRAALRVEVTINRPPLQSVASPSVLAVGAGNAQRSEPTPFTDAVNTEAASGTVEEVIEEIILSEPQTTFRTKDRAPEDSATPLAVNEPPLLVEELSAGDDVTAGTSGLSSGGLPTDLSADEILVKETLVETDPLIRGSVEKNPVEEIRSEQRTGSADRWVATSVSVLIGLVLLGGGGYLFSKLSVGSESAGKANSPAENISIGLSADEQGPQAIAVVEEQINSPTVDASGLRQVRPPAIESDSQSTRNGKTQRVEKTETSDRASRVGHIRGDTDSIVSTLVQSPDVGESTGGTLIASLGSDAVERALTVDERLALAERYLDKGFINWPEEKNAAHVLGTLLAELPGQPDALRMLDAAAATMMTQARGAYLDGFRDSAIQVVEEIMVFHPNYQPARRLHTDWMRNRQVQFLGEPLSW